jgi:hypothetical protein
MHARSCFRSLLFGQEQSDLYAGRIMFRHGYKPALVMMAVAEAEYFGRVPESSSRIRLDVVMRGYQLERIAAHGRQVQRK